MRYCVFDEGFTVVHKTHIQKSITHVEMQICPGGIEAERRSTWPSLGLPGEASWEESAFTDPQGSLHETPRNEDYD